VGEAGAKRPLRPPARVLTRQVVVAHPGSNPPARIASRGSRALQIGDPGFRVPVSPHQPSSGGRDAPRSPRLTAVEQPQPPLPPGPAQQLRHPAARPGAGSAPVMIRLHERPVMDVPPAAARPNQVEHQSAPAPAAPPPRMAGPRRPVDANVAGGRQPSQPMPPPQFRASTRQPQIGPRNVPHLQRPELAPHFQRGGVSGRSSGKP
jgi:hypothetical protein